MDREGVDAAWLVSSGLTVVTLTSVVAAYRAAGDAASVAFVAVSYAALVLLFVCLRAFERAPPGAVDRRERLKLAVWSLSTLLTVLFAWKVAGLMPWPAALLVWAMAAVTTLGGFFLAFFRRD